MTDTPDPTDNNDLAELFATEAWFRGGIDQYVHDLLTPIRQRLDTIESRLTTLEGPTTPEPEVLWDESWPAGGTQDKLSPLNRGDYPGDNNHHHTWEAGSVVRGGARGQGLHLLARDRGEGAAVRFPVGGVTTRPQGDGSGVAPLERCWPLYGTYEFDVTLPNDGKLRPAIWMRPRVGGSSALEWDVVEQFAAHDGAGISRHTIHYDRWTTAKRVMVWHRAAPAADALVGRTRHTITATASPAPTGLRMRVFVDDALAVDHQLRSDATHVLDQDQEHFWDLMVNNAIGGNWDGDPTKPYVGFLQNGTEGKPPAEVPWRPLTGDGIAFTIHRCLFQRLA